MCNDRTHQYVHAAVGKVVAMKVKQYQFWRTSIVQSISQCLANDSSNQLLIGNISPKTVWFCFPATLGPRYLVSEINTIAPIPSALAFADLKPYNLTKCRNPLATLHGQLDCRLLYKPDESYSCKSPDLCWDDNSQGPLHQSQVCLNPA